MASKHTFQTPRGTRDFYPEDMAIRRYIESVWREVSINHGFEEIEGPMFEHLDLYKQKSGEGIVNELFSFKRAGGKTEYALRPEFTPTLARMYAAKARELPKPTKWFVIPNHFRAERPQRGRLREFMQWNVDLIGLEHASADAEIIAVLADMMDRFGLSHEDVQIKISHRRTVSNILLNLGLSEDKHPNAFDLLDRRDKLPPDVFAEKAATLGIDSQTLERFDQIARMQCSLTRPVSELANDIEILPEAMADLTELQNCLEALGLLNWCHFDLGIVRGLAYYTGTVFEIHETTGKERAIAGGGRYDRLIEMFGGPPTPAVGVAMGDVVLRLVLEDHGLLKPAIEYMPRPDVYIINISKHGAESFVWPLVAKLRGNGLHVRHSYRATRNVGKLLGEAGKVRAKLAVILGDELADGLVTVKNLDSGVQESVSLDELTSKLPALLGDCGE